MYILMYVCMCMHVCVCQLVDMRINALLARASRAVWLLGCVDYLSLHLLYDLLLVCFVVVVV